MGARVDRMESHLIYFCTAADADDVDLTTAQQASSMRAKRAAAASKRARRAARRPRNSLG